MAAKAKPAAKKKKLTKAGLLNEISAALGEELSRRQIKDVYEALVEIGHRETRETGVFVLPGFAKFTVVEKPARPAREGINPFTKEPMTFAAKPASKVVRVRPVKALKDTVAE